MIIDLAELWLLLAAALALGGFTGALLHDFLAGGRYERGQAAVVEVAALAVGAANRGMAARGARSTRRAIERHEASAGREPPRLASPSAEGKGTLSRLPGLRPEAEAALNGLGIFDTEQIARWELVEERWIAHQLGVSPRRVHRWVNRAQMPYQDELPEDLAVDAAAEELIGKDLLPGELAKDLLPRNAPSREALIRAAIAVEPAMQPVETPESIAASALAERAVMAALAELGPPAPKEPGPTAPEDPPRS